MKLKVNNFSRVVRISNIVVGISVQPRDIVSLFSSDDYEFQGK
jgi:hypothetical protein